MLKADAPGWTRPPGQPDQEVKLLAVSDQEVSFLYSLQVAARFADVSMVISCGDLPYFYLEYILSMLDVPLYFVRGNHANRIEEGLEGLRLFPWGATNLHRRVIRHEGVLMAGIEGCVRYNNGPVQYTQGEYWSLVLSLAPALLRNKIRFGRYLDLFITHAPPWGIHDLTDPAHRGIKAFRWLLDVFKPAAHLHGHVHRYRSSSPQRTLYGQTRVINIYGYQELSLQSGHTLA